MTIDRRSFLAGAAALAIPAQARSAETERGRSVTEFGVEPNAADSRQEALQKAIDDISAAGKPVYIPAGTYRVRDLELPPECILNGDPGRTILLPRPIGAGAIMATRNQTLQVSGIVFDGRATKDIKLDLATYVAMISRGIVVIRECEFRNLTGGAIHADNVSAIFTMNHFHDCNHGALIVQQARSILIRQCRFEDCSSAPPADLIEFIIADGQDVQIADNFITRCSAGIRARGNGEIKDNAISGPGTWGMMLGGSTEDTGGLVVTGNTITGFEVGIALASGSEWLSITKNAISSAPQGAIRAFDGKALTGPDLAFATPGTYPNLGLADNVVRPAGNSP